MLVDVPVTLLDFLVHPVAHRRLVVPCEGELFASRVRRREASSGEKRLRVGGAPGACTSKRAVHGRLDGPLGRAAWRRASRRAQRSGISRRRHFGNDAAGLCRQAVTQNAL